MAAFVRQLCGLACALRRPLVGDRRQQAVARKVTRRYERVG